MKNLYTERLARLKTIENLKNGKNRDRIRENIRALQNELADLDRSRIIIADDKSYKDYLNKLERLADNAFEKFSAPNVEDFIEWLVNIGVDHNNCNDLKKYLVNNYNDKINHKIDKILNNSKWLFPGDTIFAKLLKSLKNDLVEWIGSILDDHEKIPNNLDDLLDNIVALLEGLADIKEITYTEMGQLFTEEQVKRNILWYKDIIINILKSSQQIKAVDETEKDIKRVERVRNRVSDIKECIRLLDQTNISISNDTAIQTIFMKYQDKMIESDGGIKNNLEGFIKQTWTKLENNYQNIKKFHFANKEISNNKRWETFLNGEITALVDNYNKILQNNILINIVNYMAKGITDNLTRYSDEIEKYQKKSDDVKNMIIEEYNKTYREYRERNIPLLERLSENYPKINNTINSLKKLLEGIEASCNNISKEDNLARYLQEPMVYDLNTIDNIGSTFKEALQESGHKDHLAWLDHKMNGVNSVDIKESDIENIEVVKALLNNGLITIKMEKNF